MTGLALTFVAVFVLVIAAACALLVLRMLGPLELPDNPPFPRRRRPHHSVTPQGAPDSQAGKEELAGKR